MVARAHVVNVRTHGLNHSRRLVSQYHGKRASVVSFDKVQVAVTYATRNRSYQHLPGPRLRNRDVLDNERLLDFLKNGGLHVVLSRDLGVDSMTRNRRRYGESPTLSIVIVSQPESQISSHPLANAGRFSTMVAKMFAGVGPSGETGCESRS